MKHENMFLFRCRQIGALCKLYVAGIGTLFVKKREIWLISERGTDARDNGYCFFLYMMQQYADKEVYYLIAKDSPDRQRLIAYRERLVDFGSLQHYCLLWQATYLISSHIQGYFPFPGMGLWLKKTFSWYRQKKHISLKHGITKDYMNFLDYTNTHVDLIISALYPEYDYFITKYKYPKEKVALTGFCRFDYLNDFQTKKQILLMPTWREWNYKASSFEKSDYAQTYLHLLQSSQLDKLLVENHITLLFYPHHEVQPHINFFKNNIHSTKIIVADSKEYDVQQLLKDSLMLITDYSSVYFDMAYMKKPILYYQFDRERYRKEHYAQGWFDYDNSFGQVAKSEDDLLKLLVNICKNNFMMDIQYESYAERLFAYRDSRNCERVYNAITHLK